MILEIIFKDYQKINNSYYVRVEYHRFDSETGNYFIANRVHKSDERGTIGGEVYNYADIITIWAEIVPELELKNIKAPLFGYFKPAVSNHIDTKSSEGVSIFSRAEDAIKRADEQLSSLLREFRVKEAKTHVSELAVNGLTLPHLEDDFYIKLRLEGKDGGSSFFDTYSPVIYSKEYLEVLDEYKREVEDCVGIAHGTISNPATVSKTATEVRLTKDRTAVLVSESQNNLQKALEVAVYAMSVWQKYPTIPNEIRVTSNWDDSSWVDRNAKHEAMRLDVREGYISPIYYLMEKYGWTEEEAHERMPISDDIISGETPPKTQNPQGIGDGVE